MATSHPVPFLLIRAGTRRFALRAADVEEVMRPQPLESVAGVPDCIRGLAVIRGAPVPVVDLARLLADAGGGPASRFVSLRAGARRAALAVEEVLGLRSLDAAGLEAMPSLLPGGGAAREAVGVLEARLLSVLEAARLVPEAAWDALERPRA